MTHKTIPLEDDYKTTKSKGISGRPGYTVEARFDLINPEKIGCKIYDNRWRQVEFDLSASSIPMSHVYHHNLIDHGLLSYSAAQALRWWFHAQAEIECFGASGRLQTRLVRHRLTCEYEVEAIGVVDD